MSRTYFNKLALAGKPPYVFLLSKTVRPDFGGRYTLNNMECFKAPPVRPTHQWFNQYQFAMCQVYKGHDR